MTQMLLKLRLFFLLGFALFGLTLFGVSPTGYVVGGQIVGEPETTELVGGLVIPLSIALVSGEFIWAKKKQQVSVTQDHTEPIVAQA